MNLYNQMMAFIAVVEENSFTRAAEKLNVTTTAISKQIKQLENHVGQQLLDRNTRKVKITEIGQRFYDHCKRVEQETKAAEAFIQSQSEEPQGRLRIRCAIMFAKVYLIKHLQEFRERYPLIQVEIDLADRIPDMEREEFDIVAGFKMRPEIDLQLRHRKLLSTRYLLCASKSYLEKYGTPRTPTDLKQHCFINHPLRQPINLINFKDGTQIYTKPPEIVINELDALIGICCDGAGILLVCDIQVSHLLKTGKLIQLLPNYPLEELSVYLFYRHSEYEQRKVRCFIDFVLEKI